METNEIMETTEMAVEAATEEFVKFEPNKLTKGLGIGAAIATGLGVLYALGKYVIKPKWDKHKAIKEEQAILDAEATVEDVVEEIE